MNCSDYLSKCSIGSTMGSDGNPMVSASASSGQNTFSKKTKSPNTTSKHNCGHNRLMCMGPIDQTAPNAVVSGVVFYSSVHGVAHLTMIRSTPYLFCF